MAIPPATIEEVSAANDIVDVIGSYFPLKRAGTNFKALCPFHQEKTPSFTVSPQRQSFHCFGCGVGGSVFRFVMDYEHVDFPAAVQKLAARAGIRIVEERQSVDEDRQHEARRALLALHAEATEWFHQNLMKRDLGAPARAYLKARGITNEVARNWKLGFAPDGWTTFSDWAAGEGYRPAQLIASGLVKVRDETKPSGEFYDRFRGRLMFPINNDIGEVIAFSGRVLEPEATAAKYLNSPETPLFRKGQVLFGLHKTKRALIDAESAVICEGQLDLITLFEAGIANVVAPQGTAFTETQARVLKRYVREVILCFDADTAGQKAAERSLEALLENDLAVRVIEMPAGEDPDSLVRKSGSAAFNELVKNAREFFDFWLEKKTGTADLNSMREKMNVARELATTAAHVREPLLRGEVVNRMAARLGLPAAEFEKLVPRSEKRETERPEAREPKQNGTPPSHDVAMLCLLALRDDEARAFLQRQEWEEVVQKIPDGELLQKILRADLQPSEPASLVRFQTSLEASEEATVSNWMLQKVPGDPAAVARGWWKGVAQQALRRDLEIAEGQLKLPNLTGGEIMQLQKQVLDLQKQLHEFHRLAADRAENS